MLLIMYQRAMLAGADSKGFSKSKWLDLKENEGSNRKQGHINHTQVYKSYKRGKKKAAEELEGKKLRLLLADLVS